ncbi:hypothetical protein GBF38_009554 [Nibea albiflora]|uniref:Uncharacterized protein n=1 Tax=Nibea albiflora TaxID=240163 RepID=A0ACB7F8X3_NIBAL|nr:hypothetical protein GBF38_009554 [Nibea albiflora]
MLSFSPWALLPPIYSAGTAAGLCVVYFMAVGDEKVAPLSSASWRRNGISVSSLHQVRARNKTSCHRVQFLHFSRHTNVSSCFSIAGNFPPASCVFSEVMNVAAFLGFIVAVLRYLQLKPRIHNAWLNVSSLLAFSAACFGMTLVGNFQLFNDEITHNLGTFMTFGLGTLFCWVQSYVTLRVDIKNEGRKAGVLRFLLSGCITLCMILYFSLMGQGFHMHASRCQWALVMFFLIFISTFAIEFRHSRFNAACTDAAGPLNVNEAFSEVTRYQPDQM